MSFQFPISNFQSPIWNESTLLDAAYFCLLGAAVVYVVNLVAGRKWPGRWPGVWMGRGATALSVVSLLFLSGGLVARSVNSGHWPLATTYEFCLVFVWGVIFVYLLLEQTMNIRAGGAFALPVAFLLATYARLGIPPGAKVAQPPLPALRTVWLPLHALTAMLAYGAFAVACGAGVMYLVREALGPAVDESDGRFPSLAAIDRFGFRAVAFGYPWLTLTIVIGAIWAQMAWGNYWSWDLKEVWTLITWLVYTLFFHVRVLKGWRGRPVAVLAIVGFAVVLFTFLGVGELARWVGLESLHVY